MVIRMIFIQRYAGYLISQGIRSSKSAAVSDNNSVVAGKPRYGLTHSASLQIPNVAFRRRVEHIGFLHKRLQAMREPISTLNFAVKQLNGLI